MLRRGAVTSQPVFIDAVNASAQRPVADHHIDHHRRNRLTIYMRRNDRGERFHIAAKLARGGNAAVPMRKLARSEDQREFSLQIHPCKRFAEQILLNLILRETVKRKRLTL